MMLLQSQIDQQRQPVVAIKMVGNNSIRCWHRMLTIAIFLWVMMLLSWDLIWFPKSMTNLTSTFSMFENTEKKQKTQKKKIKKKNFLSTNQVHSLNTVVVQESRQRRQKDHEMVVEAGGIETEIETRHAMEGILRDGHFCVRWDDVVDLWWTHHPTWNVVEESEDGICFQNTTYQDDGKLQQSQFRRVTFLNRLHHLQYGSCENVYTRYLWNYGIGYEINNIVKGFTYGMQKQRPFQFVLDPGRGPWRYSALPNGTKSTCPTKDYFCYFLPFSDCPPSPVNVSEGIQAYVPISDERMWMTEYALRQQQPIRHLVYQYLQTQGFLTLPTPCAILHVRRADAVLEPNGAARKYFSIEDYLHRLEQSHRVDLATALQSIFLLTDDQNAIEEAQLFHPQYQWKFFQRPRHRGASGGYQNHNPSGDPKLEMIAMLASLRLVQQCKIIVRGTSTFGDMLAMSMRIQAYNTNTTFQDVSVEEAGKASRSKEYYGDDKRLEEKIRQKKQELESLATVTVHQK
jgi:hypothetical protein